MLTGVAPGALTGEPDDFRAALAANAETIGQRVREQGVQTNEVQRCTALLPAFLTVARETGKPIELLELGPSAGLNLLLDRYRYRQTASTGYLPAQAAAQLRDTLAAAGADGRPLAWVSTRRTDEREGERDDMYELELRVWPAEARLACHMDFHGNWLEWLLES